jgi:hypothetical protein
MSNKNILFQKLDLILRKMFGYSLILGPWGKYVWFFIYPGYGYRAESYVVKPDEINEFEHGVCKSCRENIHVQIHLFHLV